MRIQSVKLLIIALVLLPLQVLAHDGPHDELELLPPYLEKQQAGHAALKITKVGSNFVIAFTGPQSNFLGTDKSQLDKKLGGKRDHVITQMKQLSFFLNDEDFQCSPLIAKATYEEKHRVTEKDIYKKYKGKKVNPKSFIQGFVAFGAYFKVSCKKDILLKSLKIRLFKNAPNLKSLHLNYMAGRNIVKKTIGPKDNL